MIILFLPLSFHLFNPIPEKPEDSYYEAKVIKVYDNSMVVNIGDQNVYLMTEIEESLQVGDFVYFSSDFLYSDTTEGFDLFLKSNKSTYYAYVDEYQIEYKNTLRNEFYRKTIAIDSNYSDFATLLLYKRVSPSNEDLDQAVTNLGISHLFAVSGFHISILIVSSAKLLNKTKLNESSKFWINFSFASLILYWLYLPPTGIRALLFFFIRSKTDLTKYNSLGLTGLIFFSFNPWLLLTGGMLISFMVTFMLLTISSDYSTKLKNLIFVSICAFTIAFPIVSSWNTELNLLAPLYTIIFSPLISIAYAICLLCIPFVHITIIFEPFFLILGHFMIFINNYAILFYTVALENYELILYMIISISLIKHGSETKGLTSILIISNFFAIKIFT